MTVSVRKPFTPTIFVSLLLLFFASVVGKAQGTSFTYQGKLTDAGNPANANYDIQFKLFDTATVGTGVQQGSTITNSTVAVSSGSFAVTLDFGANVFTGAALYLEIGVRPAGSPNPFSVLSPRQPITPTPYAIQTVNATQLGGLSANRFVSSDATGNVGIGTTNPNSKLDVRGSLTLEAGSSPGLFTGTGNTELNRYLNLLNSPTLPSASGLKAGGILVSDDYFFSNPGKNDLIVKGNIGIGTASLSSKLTVQTPTNNYGLTHTDGTITLGEVVGNSAAWLGTLSNHQLNLFANNLPPSIAIATNGNVGIGTVSPLSELHIVSGSSGLPPRLQSAGTTSFAAGWDFYHGATGKGYVGVPDPSAGFGAGEMLLFGGPGTKTSLWAGSTRSITLETNGNVGIGTTAPTNVKLQVDGASGIGIYATTTGASVSGVVGVSSNASGAGVTGRNTVGNIGVYGESPFAGVYGHDTGATGYGVFGDGGNYGVYGSNGSTTGVRGDSNGGRGVWGDSLSGQGVYGHSNSNSGVVGVSESSDGVFGESHSISTAGVSGHNTAGGFAGYFVGNVTVTGTLSKGGGSFKIDHPLDPENKYLYHSFVESPDMMNIYNGNVSTDERGEATITLPEYFEALNRDFRYQLTVIGQFAQAIIANEIKDNRFTIKTDKPNVKVSWQVTGIRQDAYANANRIRVEEDKPQVDRGRYLHPEAFNQPEDKGIGRARSPEQSKKLNRQWVDNELAP